MKKLLIDIVAPFFFKAYMIKKTMRHKKSNPIAKDLRTPKYKQQSAKSKKIYNRKKKTIS